MKNKPYNHTFTSDSGNRSSIHVTSNSRTSYTRINRGGFRF